MGPLITERWTDAEGTVHLVAFRQQVTLCGDPVDPNVEAPTARVGCEDCVKASIADYAANHRCGPECREPGESPVSACGTIHTTRREEQIPTMTAPSGVMTDELRQRFADVPLRIGTRTTPLAKAQTQCVVAQIEQRVPGLPIETIGIETSADLWTGDLSLLGGKGNFTKEIDRSLISGRIDIAVHSMKDVPGDVPLPRGTEFGAYLLRGDVHDVVISRDGRPLADLPAGAKIGTSAVRRHAQLGLYRPDLIIERVRGSVNRRINKLDDGEYDAILLARAGLERVGLDHRITEVLPTTWADGEPPPWFPPSAQP
ncbi:hydroxymethylbilane synthase [Saccharopolyspora thermophila]|uniref:Hydroxymethylbilane synthase n=1 Tax=Saccharopolyspora thermophila TaxID=89367 RepID=A0ABN1BUP8_9PSEU